MALRVHELHDEAGNVFAFEVSTTLGGRTAVTNVVRRLSGAHLIRTPKLFSWFREESFCEFELAGTRFEIFEPYGDNSRYWVGPVDTSTLSAEIPTLIEAFRAA